MSIGLAAAAQADVIKHATHATAVTAGAKKTLTVAIDATNPPYEFLSTNGSNFQGIDPQLIRALGKAMNVNVVLKQENFASIVPALQASKYDLAISSMLDTKAREQAVSFVDYLATPATFIISDAVKPASMKSWSDLCGKTVAAQAGTVGVAQIQAQKQKCHGNMKILLYPTESSVVLAVSSKRAQVAIEATAVGAYLVSRSHGKLKLAVAVFPQGGDDMGIVVPKSNTALAHQILAGLKTIIANGTYAKILRHWGALNAAIKHPSINNAVS